MHWSLAISHFNTKPNAIINVTVIQYLLDLPYKNTIAALLMWFIRRENPTIINVIYKKETPTIINVIYKKGKPHYY